MSNEERLVDAVSRRLLEAAERAAEEREALRLRRMARPEDYVYDKAQEAYWDIEDNTLHTEKAVDASIPIELWRVEVEEGDAEPPEGEPRRRGRPRRRRERLVPPSRDIMRVENDRFVEGSTWWPGMEKIIRDWFIDKDGFFPALGRRSFNQYRAPPVVSGVAAEAGPWLEHVKKLWPEEREHEYFFDYCAHMVQRPEEKCNAAVILSGTQGIGKDAALVAVKEAVGAWNTKGIDPDELFSPYRPWIQTLMLVIDEVRPTKDEFHASSMYNILKPMIAAPPDTLALNDKYAKLRHIINVLRVFITTNDWMAMYVPPEDRRMFVMHSTLPQKWHETEGKPSYFVDYFHWLTKRGGFGAVSAFLRERDLSRFDPKRQVERTLGWEAVAGSWTTGDDVIADVLERLGRPDVLFGQELVEAAFDDREEIASMLKSPRKIAHRLQREGYLLRRRPDGDRWTFGAKGAFRSRLAFVKHNLLASPAEAMAAIEARGAELAARAIASEEGRGVVEMRRAR